MPAKRCLRSIFTESSRRKLRYAQKNGKGHGDMKKFECVIKDQLGIHARPAGLIARRADKYRSRITLRIGGRPADAGKIMSIMMLGARCGQTMEVEIEGEDEEAAYDGMTSLLQEIL